MTVPFQLKIPKDIHKEIKRKALDADTTMHQYILDCVNRPPFQTLDNVSFGEKKVQPPKEAKECEWCGFEIELRNPSGNCDHLYYPDNVNKDKKPKEPTVVSKEEGIMPFKTDNLVSNSIHPLSGLENEETEVMKNVEYTKKGLKVKKEKKHQPNCSCFTCKPPKTK